MSSPSTLGNAIKTFPPLHLYSQTAPAIRPFTAKAPHAFRKESQAFDYARTHGSLQFVTGPLFD